MSEPTNEELQKQLAALRDQLTEKDREIVEWKNLVDELREQLREVAYWKQKVKVKDARIFHVDRTEDTKHVKPAWGHRLESRMESLVLGLFSGSDDPSRERDVALTARFASMLAYSPSDTYNEANRGRLRKLELEELKLLNRTLVKIGEEIGGCDPASMSTVIASQQQALSEALDLLSYYWQFHSYREILAPGIENICSFALRMDLIQAMMDVMPDRFGHVFFHWHKSAETASHYRPLCSLDIRSKLFVNMCNFISGISDFRRDLLLPALSACCGLCDAIDPEKSGELCFDEAKASMDTFISLAGHSDGHIRALALRMIGYFSSGTNDEAVDYTLVRGAARAVCTALSDGRTNTAPARKDCWWTLYNWSAGSKLQRSFLFDNQDDESENVQSSREQLDFCLLALRCFAKERDFLVTQEIAIFLEKALAENDFPDNLILSSIDFVIGSRFNTDTMLMKKTTASMKGAGNKLHQVRDIEICWMLWLLGAILTRCVRFAQESDTNLAALKQYENTLEKAFEMLCRYRDSYLSKGGSQAHPTWFHVMGSMEIPENFAKIAVDDVFGIQLSSLRNSLVSAEKSFWQNMGHLIEIPSRVPGRAPLKFVLKSSVCLPRYIDRGTGDCESYQSYSTEMLHWDELQAAAASTARDEEEKRSSHDDKDKDANSSRSGVVEDDNETQLHFSYHVMAQCCDVHPSELEVFGGAWLLPPVKEEGDHLLKKKEGIGIPTTVAEREITTAS